MPTEQKKNDMFLNVISNPTYTALDFMDVGLNETNTSILPYDIYKNNEQVRKAFTKDGKFDEEALKNTYNAANAMLYEMAGSNMNQQIAKEFEFQPGSLFALSFDNPKFDTDISDTTIETQYGENGIPYNPDRDKMGVAGIGITTPGTKSMRELAQMSDTWNSETGEWEESPETWFGEHWFENIFNPRVYATYSESDPEVQRGEKKAGEWKIGPNGTYYTERLNGRPTYDKQVVSLFDTLTKEDSWINRYDFFDSDDKEKSVAGSIFKNLAIAVPALVGGPVSAVYLGVSTGLQAMQLMAGVGKLIAGTDVEWLNNTDGFLKQFDMSTSDHSQENTWTFENLAGMASQVYLQLAQQRYLFENVPRLFGYKAGMNPDEIAKMTKEIQGKHLTDIMKKAKDPNFIVQEAGKSGMPIQDFIKEYVGVKTMRDVAKYEEGARRIGEVLSKGYMTGITTLDSYDSAKQEGASDMQAALLALGYSFGEYKLLSTGIGEMVMPELRANRKMVKKAVEKAMGITEEAKKNGSFYTKDGKKSLFRKIMQIGKDIADGSYHGKQTLAAIAANGLGEGIEEMSEEALYDFTKTINNAFALVSDDVKPLTAWDNMFDRYTMSFIGGAIGGSVFNASANFKALRDADNMTNEQAQQFLLYKLREGQRDEIEKVLDKTTFGIRTMKDVQTDDNGTLQFIPGNAFENQDKMIKDEFRKVLDSYETILKREGLNYSDSRLFNEILPDYRYSFINRSMAAASHMSGFQNALNNLTNAYKNYDRLMKASSGDATDAELKKILETTPDMDKAIENANEEIEKARQEARSYVDGEKAKHFILKGVFEADPNLNIGKELATLGNYSLFRNGKPLGELSQDQREKTMEEFAEIQRGGGVSNLDSSYEQFMAMLKVVNPTLDNITKEWYKKIAENKAVQRMMQHRANVLANFDKVTTKAMEEGDTGLANRYIQELASDRNLYIDANGNVNGVDSGKNMELPAFSTAMSEADQRAYFRDHILDVPFKSYRNWRGRIKVIEDDMRKTGRSFEESSQEIDKLSDDDITKRYVESFDPGEGSTAYDGVANLWQFEKEVLGDYIGSYIQESLKQVEEIANSDIPISKDVKAEALKIVSTVRSLMRNNGIDDLIESVSNGSMAAQSNAMSVSQLLENHITNNTALSDEDRKTMLDIMADVNALNDIIPMVYDDVDERTLSGVYMEDGERKYDRANFEDATHLYHMVASEWIKKIEAMTGLEQSDKDSLIKSINDTGSLLDKATEEARQSINDTMFFNADTFSKLDGYEKAIKDKKETPVFELLDSFQIDDKGTKASDVMKAMEDKLSAARVSTESFVLSDDELDMLANVEKEAQHILSAIYASTEDTASATNPFGFVNSYNELMKDTEGFQQMNLLKKQDMQPMAEELAGIVQQIQAYRKISSMNSENKLNENPKIEMNKAILSYDAISEFIGKMEEEGMDVSSVRKLLDEPDTKELVNKYRNLRNSNRSMKPTDEDMSAAIEHIMKVEETLHDMVASMDGGRGLSDATLRKVLAKYDPFISSIGSLNEQTRDFDANTKLWYLMSILASDPDSVSYAIYNAYKKLSNIAPTAQQVMSLKGLVSYMTGRDTYSRASKLFKESVINKAREMLGTKDGAAQLKKSLDAMGLAIGEMEAFVAKYDEITADPVRLSEYRKKILYAVANSKSFNIFDNMYWVGGMPGSGKTMGVAVTAASALVAKDDSDTAVIDGGEDAVNEGIMVVSKQGVAENLSNNIKEHLGDSVSKITVKDFDDFLKEHFSITDRSDFLKEDNVGVDTTNAGDFTMHSLIGTKPEGMPKILMIDEGTLLNQVEMDAINRLAGESGSIVIVFGDEDQIKRRDKVPSVKDQDKFELSSPDYVYPVAESQFPHAPKIGSSMRTNNVQKDANIVTIRDARDKMLSTGVIAPFELHYAENENGLYGEQVIDDASAMDTIKRMVEDVKKDKKNNPDGYEKIGVVTNSKAIRDKLSALDPGGEYFNFFDSAIDTQGFERKYYIYYDPDVPVDSMSFMDKKEFMDKLYTVTSRSKQYTLIVNDRKYDGIIRSAKDSSTSVTRYDRNAIASYNKKYTGILKSVFDEKMKDGKKIKPLKLTFKKAAAPVKPADPSEPALPKTPDIDMTDPDKGEGGSSENPPRTDEEKLLDNRFESDDREKGVVKKPALPVRKDGGLNKADSDTRFEDDTEKKVAEANDTPDRLFGGNTNGRGNIYTHPVDTMGLGVIEDEDNNTIELIGFDSTGLNGVTKLIYGVQSILGSRVKQMVYNGNNPTNENGMRFRLVFDNADEMNRFKLLAHRMLVHIRALMVDGPNSASRGMPAKVDAVKSEIERFIMNVYGLDSLDDNVKNYINKLFSNLSFWFKKTKISEEDKDKPIWQYRGEEERLFDSQMQVVNSMVGSRVSMIIDNNNGVTMEIPLFTIENPVTKARSKEYMDLMDWATNITTNSTDNEVKNVAQFILAVYNGGERTSIGTSTLKAFDGNGNVERFNSLRKKVDELIDNGKIPAEYANQMRYLLSLYRIYMKDREAIQLDNSLIDNLLSKATVSGPRMHFSDVDAHSNHNYDYYVMRVPVEKLENEGVFDVSDIMFLAKDLNINGRKVIGRGQPFIIINEKGMKMSAADNLRNYVNQMKSGIDYGLRMYYVCPPKVDIEQFFNKLKNIVMSPITKEKLSEKDKLIGNSFTAYRMLETLFTDKDGNVRNNTAIIINDTDVINIPSKLETYEGYEKPSGPNPNNPRDFIMNLVRIGKLLESSSPEEFSRFIDDNSVYINGALLHLAYSMALGKGFKFDTKNNAKYKAVINELKNRGFKSVSLNVTGKGDWNMIDGIDFKVARTEEGNRFHMAIKDGTETISLPFMVYGKVDTSMANANMGELFDHIINRFQTNRRENNRNYEMMHRNPFMIGPVSADEDNTPNIIINDVLGSSSELPQSVRDKINSGDIGQGVSVVPVDGGIVIVHGIGNDFITYVINDDVRGKDDAEVTSVDIITAIDNNDMYIMESDTRTYTLTANDNKDINIEVTNKPNVNQDGEATKMIELFFSENDNKDGVESFLEQAQNDETFVEALTLSGNDEDGFIDALSNLYDNPKDINAINKFIECVGNSMAKGEAEGNDYSPIAYEITGLDYIDSDDIAIIKVRDLVNKVFDIYKKQNNTCGI